MNLILSLIRGLAKVGLRRTVVAVAVSLLLVGPAHAICIDVGHFRQIMANAGQSIRYAAIVKVRNTPTPAYIAIGRDGAWTAFFVYRETFACVIASGRRWTKQGEIPPADLRPGG